jgi:tRNA U38,U39,U40 pseudouridine synthase TruA
MADSVRKNLKAEKFEKYLKDHNITFFTRHDLNDESQSVLFRSNIEAEGQRLPVNVVTDSSIYTIIRVLVGTSVVKDSNREKFMEFLNDLNRHYKVFKYVASEEGDLFLDCCLPSTNDSFDPVIVHAVLDVVVQHLQEEYSKIMKLAWAD